MGWLLCKEGIMLYAVDIFETIIKTLTIEAETEEAAKKEAMRRYFSGESIEPSDPIFDCAEIDVEATAALNKSSKEVYAMSKVGKLARVRYIPGGQDDHGEGYALEMKTGKDEWDLICQTKLRKSKDFPDAAENEFIHFTFMNEIFYLLELGYRVYRI